MEGKRRGMKDSKKDKMRKGWLGGRKKGRKKIMEEKILGEAVDSTDDELKSI